jgi:hypothetical protein
VKHLILSLSLGFFIGCCGVKSTYKPLSEADSLRLEIKFIEDELRFKEREISYWGHRYDSAIIELNKCK